MVRRNGRATVVFVEAVLAVAVAGVVLGVARHAVVGYVVAGLALLVGVAGLVRPGGRGLVDVLAERLRHSPEEPALSTSAQPDLHVVDVRTRAGDGIGVAGDGQGFVVVLDPGLAAPPSWAVASLVEILVDDPARPAAVQVVVEQHGLGPSSDPRFGPARSYRSLPVGGLPLWNRVLIAIRHEPAWAPETAESRGGGATGARNALAAVAGRTVARAARDGIRLRPLSAAELTGVLHDLAPGADDPRDVAVAVPLARVDAIGALLPVLAGLDVARSVLAVTASAVDHSLFAAARLTDPRRSVAEDAAEQLVADGLAVPLPRAQEAGLLATLPLGGGARSLEGVVGQARR